MAFVETTADETANSVTVRIAKDEVTGAMEAMLLPLPGALLRRLHKHDLFPSSAFDEPSDVPTGLAHAVCLQAWDADVRSIRVQLSDGAEWDDAWGELRRAG